MDVRIGIDGEKRRVERALIVPADGGIGMWLTVPYGNIGQIRVLMSSEEIAAIVKVALTGERQEIVATLAEPTTPR